MPTKLTIACDLGASLTKVFYRFSHNGQTIDQVSTFASAVQRTNQSRYLAGQYGDDNTSLLEFNGEYWLVGVAAKQEVAVTNVRAAKHTHAVAKVLAAVGQVLSRYGPANGAGVEIELGILLPLDEITGDLSLSDRISQHLYGFGHNGQCIQGVIVKAVAISPEGYGYALAASKSPAGILLFGHRDLAYLHVERGSISLADSQALPGRGMVKLIKETHYVFKDELRAAAAIFAAGESCRPAPLLKLVPAPDLSRLQQALRESRQLVWQQLQDELMPTSLRSQELVICGGGNSYYWKPELKAAFGPRLSFAGQLLAELQTHFPQLKNDPLLPRCADCYRFWRSLPGMSEQPSPALVIAGG